MTDIIVDRAGNADYISKETYDDALVRLDEQLKNAKENFSRETSMLYTLGVVWSGRKS